MKRSKRQQSFYLTIEVTTNKVYCMVLDPISALVIGGLAGLVFLAIGLAKFSIGVDKTLSLTNVQIILWSGVILGSYLSLALLKGGFLTEISPNLMAVMGISAGSLVAAKSIRTVQEDQLKRKADATKTPYKSDRSNETTVTKGLLSEEKVPENLSVAKLQMFAWTLAVIAIFAIIVVGNVLSNKIELPDIGVDLLALMGISHGAYIGNKIADKRE
jgi:hypothetical protein